MYLKALLVLLVAHRILGDCRQGDEAECAHQFDSATLLQVRTQAEAVQKVQEVLDDVEEDDEDEEDEEEDDIDLEGLLEEDAGDESDEGLGDMCSHFTWDHAKICRNADGTPNNNGNCQSPMYWDYGPDPDPSVVATFKPGCPECFDPKKVHRPGFDGPTMLKPACGHTIHESQMAGCNACKSPHFNSGLEKQIGMAWGAADENGRLCHPVCVNRVKHQSYRKVMSAGGWPNYYVGLMHGNASCRKPARNCNYNDHTRKSFYSDFGMARKCNPSFDTKVFDTCANDPSKPENCEFTAGKGENAKVWNVMNTCFDGAWDKMCAKNKCFMLFEQEPRAASLLGMNESYLEDGEDEDEDDEDEDDEDEDEVDFDDEESLLEEESLFPPPSCKGWCAKINRVRNHKVAWFDVSPFLKAPKCAWFKCSTCKECENPPSTCIPWCFHASAKKIPVAMSCKNTAFKGCSGCDFCGGTISTKGAPPVTTPAPVAPATTPAPAAPITPPAPTPAPVVPVTTPAPAAPVTTPAPAAPVTTPAPAAPVTTPAPAPPPAKESPPSPPVPPSKKGKCIATCQTYSSSYGLDPSCVTAFKEHGCPYLARAGKGSIKTTDWSKYQPGAILEETVQIGTP